MLSIDLFDSRYEKHLHEGAVDKTIARMIEPMSRKAADIRTRIRAGGLDPKEIDRLEKEYEDLVQKRLDIILDRQPKTEQQQPPVKGLLKGKDLITPQQRVTGATTAKPGVIGAVKDVAGGIKRFVKGEPDTGPTYEQKQGQSPRAYGVANFQRLVKANMGNYPKITFEFPNAKENFDLDKRAIDLISDYYDGLENDQMKNHFIYRVLPSADESRRVLKQLGWQERAQLPLPGVSIQGELPLAEKKKFNDPGNIQAGDVKVARELQKLRAQYPGAKSDIEAVARAELDSSERSQQQLAAIRGANDKQDILLKQLVALDQEQGREIDDLDQENNSLEKRLAQVQATNDRLQTAISRMTGTKKSPERAKTDAEVGGLIDVAPVAQAPASTTDQSEPKKPARRGAAKSPAIGQMAQILPKQAPVTAKRPEIKTDIDGVDTDDVVKQYPKLTSVRQTEPANVDDFRLVGEHGGGIGPKKHWQSLMRETGRPPMDTLNYYFPDINAESDVEAIRAAIREIVNNPELSKTSKQRLLGQVGMMVQRNRALIGREWRQYIDRFSESVQETFDMPGNTIPRKSIIQGYTVFFNPETKTVSVTRGGDSEEAAIEQARIGTVNMKTFRNAAEKLIDRIDDQFMNEGIKDTAGATAVIACLLAGGSLSGCATAPQQTTAQQVLKTGQDVGRVVQNAKKITRAGTEEEAKQELRNILRGMGNRPEELNNSNILRIWKRIKGQPPVTPEPQAPEYGPAEPVKRPTTEAKEIHTREDFIKERDRLLRMIAQETNPANKQILKSAIRQLENRAENEGWIVLQQRMIREDNASDAAEQAILKRIMVAHTDLLKQFGPQKVMQAAEEVAYNVGDVAEIGSSDVSGWVKQVEQILGATP